MTVVLSRVTERTLQILNLNQNRMGLKENFSYYRSQETIPLINQSQLFSLEDISRPVAVMVMG
jgi:hypothetical protein